MLFCVLFTENNCIVGRGRGRFGRGRGRGGQSRGFMRGGQAFSHDILFSLVMSC